MIRILTQSRGITPLGVRFCSQYPKGIQPNYNSGINSPTHSIKSPEPESQSLNVFPKFMRNYVRKIRKAPLSNTVAFLMVHQAGAIASFVGIWSAFHYFNYVPSSIPTWVLSKATHAVQTMAENHEWTLITKAGKGSRLVLQGAGAYSVAKALFPLRLALSLYLTPICADKLVIPFTRIFSRSKNRPEKKL